MKMEHTDLPWKFKQGQILGNNDEGCVIANLNTKIYDERVETIEMIRNGEFIVKAANNFQSLLDACECALEEGDELKAFFQMKEAVRKAKGL